MNNHKEITLLVVRFALLVFFQIFVFNKINLDGFLNPYVYLLFLILFPVSVSLGWYLIWAFITGLTIDIFSGTGGINAMACVFAAFIRNGLLSLWFRNMDIKRDDIPMRDLLKSKGILYMWIFVFIHNFVLYTVEIFNFRRFFQIVLDALLNSILTTLFIIFILVVFSKPRKR